MSNGAPRALSAAQDKPQAARCIGLHSKSPIRLTGKEQRTIGATERLDEAKSILKEHGNYEWLTENGSFVVLNNGIEFAATYFIMLLALFFLGAGRFVSLDYWIDKKLHS